MDNLELGADDGWFNGQVLRTLDGILMGLKLSINDGFAPCSGNVTMLGALDGVVNGVMLGTDDG